MRKKENHMQTKTRKKHKTSKLMDKAHKVLVVREGIKTPVTYREGVRHLYTPNNVGLSMFDHSCVYQVK